MKAFLVRHADALIIAACILICFVLYLLATRYTVRVSHYRGRSSETVIDNWTGKTMQR